MKNFSLTAIVAGIIAVLVGYTSSAAIIFQAALSAGADESLITSWMCALGIAMGLSTIGLSWYYKAPILTAWSTPGAAILVTSLAGYSMPQAIGAFVVCAALITLSGLSGWFEKLMNRIPFPMAAGLLAGVLGRFGMDVFVSMSASWELVLPMFFAWLLFKRLTRIYAIPLVLVFAMGYSGFLGLTSYDNVELSLSGMIWTTPEFSVNAILSISLPLFVVTMASQNMPGFAVLRSAGYDTPVSPTITWTGLTTLVLAPFGCFAINLAAITAAICAGESAHPEKEKRYHATLSAGVMYLLTGVFAGTITALFASFPKEMILTLAGLALLPTIASSLTQALESAEHREAALVTFLVTLSGMTLWGIGSAFWGIVLGTLTLLVSRGQSQK